MPLRKNLIIFIGARTIKRKGSSELNPSFRHLQDLTMRQTIQYLKVHVQKHLTQYCALTAFSIIDNEKGAIEKLTKMQRILLIIFEQMRKFVSNHNSNTNPQQQQPFSVRVGNKQTLSDSSQQPNNNQVSLVHLEKLVLKLNSHAIEFIKGTKDSHRQELAREFLLKAEGALLNTPGSSNVKNKLLAITQNNLGQLCKLKSQYPQALKYMRSALINEQVYSMGLQDKDSSDRQQINLMMNIGEVLMNTGKNEQAIRYCDDGLTLIDSASIGKPAGNIVKSQVQKATILLTKGKCMERQGFLNESLLCFEEALKSYSAIGKGVGHHQQKIYMAQEIQNSIQALQSNNVLNILIQKIDQDAQFIVV